MHILYYEPAREQALHFELQVKQAARQRVSERPHPFLAPLCPFECLVTSHPPYGEFARRVYVHLLPATKVTLALSISNLIKHELRK